MFRANRARPSCEHAGMICEKQCPSRDAGAPRCAISLPLLLAISEIGVSTLLRPARAALLIKKVSASLLVCSGFETRRIRPDWL
jgi:hypothetical protein